MKVVSTFHASTSTVTSTKVRFKPDGSDEHLVIAKPDRLEVHLLSSSGLQLECTVPIYGRIVSLAQIYRDNDGPILLVLTDHPEPYLHQLISEHGEEGLKLIAHAPAISLHMTGRPAEFFTGMVIDPTGQIAVASLYAGKLRVIDYSQAEPGDGFDVNIPEHNLLSLSFLPTTDTNAPPVLALLHRTYTQNPQLLAHSLHPSSFELSTTYSPLLQPTLLSKATFPTSVENPPILLPISPRTDDETDFDPSKEIEDNDMSEDTAEFEGGVLILGGRRIMLYPLAPAEWQDSFKAKTTRQSKRKSSSRADATRTREEMKQHEMKRQPAASVEWPFGEITACEQIDGGRVILGDVFGRLAMLVVNRRALRPDMLTIIPLGETAPSTTLTYLDNGILYLGSHSGDSQLLRVHSSPIPGSTPSTLPSEIRTTFIDGSRTGKGKGKARAVDAHKEEEEWGGISTDSDGDAKGAVLAPNGSYVSVLQSFSGLAPIMDGVLVGSELYVASGGMGGGGIRAVRKGAELKEHAVVEGVRDVHSVWPLKVHSEDPHHAFMLMSTVNKTSLLRFDKTALIQRVPSSEARIAFILTEVTLAAGNIHAYAPAANRYQPSHLIAQVTPSCVRIVEATFGGDFIIARTWRTSDAKVKISLADQSIVAASIFKGQIALGLSKGHVVLLSVNEKHEIILEDRDTCYNPFESTATPAPKISAISCSPPNTEARSSMFITVAAWSSNAVAVLYTGTEGIKVAHVTPEHAHASLPVSVMLYNFGAPKSSRKRTAPASGPEEENEPRQYLLIGHADGSITSYVYAKHEFKNEGQSTKLVRVELKEKKHMVMGTTPISLTAVEMEGRKAICAAGSRAAFVFYSQGRLQQAPILVEGVSAITRVESSFIDLKTAVAVFTKDRLSIGTFGPLEEVHVRSAPLGMDTPVNIAWLPEKAVFGVACNRTVPGRVGDPYTTSNSSIKLLDGTSLSVTDSARLTGEVSTLSTVTLSCTVDGKEEYFTCLCAATVSAQPQEGPEAVVGELLLFDVEAKSDSAHGANGNMVSVWCRLDVAGCIYSICEIRGMLAVTKDHSVALLRLEHLGSGDFRLVKQSEWVHNYVITQVTALGTSELAIGDAISSVAVLTVTEDRLLKTAARDSTALWPVAIGALDEKTVVGVNVDCNFFSFRYTLGNTKLENDGSWHLGDFVNRLIPGSLAEISAGAQFTPKQLFLSSTGQIGVVSIIQDTDLALLLTGLQRNLAHALPGVGNVQHTRFRTPANKRGRSDAQPEAVGFLDGDFLERYLALAPGSEEAQAVVSGTSDAERIHKSDEEIRSLLEGLQALH